MASSPSSIPLRPESEIQGPNQARFHALVGHLLGKLKGDEVLISTFHGENSDFVRFNGGEIRQAGSVTQGRVGLRLIDGQRQAEAAATMSGDAEADRRRLERMLADLRERLPHLPDDPYLNYATEVNSTESRVREEIPDAGEAVARIQEETRGRDLVGIYASGDIYRGLINSLGQENWYATRNFNFDWSFYHSLDKAVKSAYAGLEWDGSAFARKVDLATRQLEALARKPKTIAPGRYRVYLAPSAMQDILQLLSWGGFGLKSVRTLQSPLQKLVAGEVSLASSVDLAENTAQGVAPGFQEQGFLRPESIPLVQGGQYAQSLVSPRSAKEYGVGTNGANEGETPESLEMAPGALPTDEVLSRLGTGIYVGNVWYLNYSDRPACRSTGMTRFATFWVEGGEVVAPLNVMRFDETIFRMLGENLVDLTAEREWVLDPGSYFERQIASGRYPGALVEDFNFTL